MSKTVLIVAAHGDDEALGCGGTIARHAAEGDTVHILLLADGVTSRGGNIYSSVRDNSAMNAARILGAKPTHLLGLPDNRLDTLPLLDVVQEVEKVLEELHPDIVYTHHGGDLNVDHVVTHRAVLTACRPVPGQTVRAIYGFEVLSSTEWGSPDQDSFFRPTHYVEISEQLETKLAALECYAEEMREFPHARSRVAVKALASLRGSQVGLTAAEAFTVLRQINAWDE